MKKFLMMAILWLAGAALPVAAQTYDELSQKAEVCMKEGKWADAEHWLRTAFDRDPDNGKNIVLLANLGIVQHRQGKVEEAIDTFTLALERYPDQVEFLTARAEMLMQKGENNRAYLDVCRILDLEPKNVHALMAHAYLYFDRGEFKGACADYKKVLELEPENRTAKFGWAVAEQKAGNNEKALALIDEMLEGQDTEPWIVEARANVLCALERHEEAMADINRVIGRPESGPSAYVTRGDIWLAMKKKRKAKADYQKALELGAPFADVQVQLKKCR